MRNPKNTSEWMNASNESILVVDDNARKSYCIMPNNQLSGRLFFVMINLILLFLLKRDCRGRYSITIINNVLQKFSEISAAWIKKSPSKIQRNFPRVNKKVAVKYAENFPREYYLRKIGIPLLICQVIRSNTKRNPKNPLRRRY